MLHGELRRASCTCVACVEGSAHDVTTVSCRFSLAIRQFWHYARSKK